VQAYAVCIGVTPECRWMESEMIRDGQGRADEVDEAYHDNNPFPYSVISHTLASCRVALVTLPCIISEYAGLTYSPALKST